MTREMLVILLSDKAIPLREHKTNRVARIKADPVSLAP